MTVDKRRKVFRNLLPKDWLEVWEALKDKCWDKFIYWENLFASLDSLLIAWMEVKVSLEKCIKKDSEGYTMINGRRITKVLVNGKEEVSADFIDEILDMKAAEQKDFEEKIANDEPLMQVENMPEFPGGSMAMMQYLSGNIKYPEEARDNNIQGRVIIQFIVEKDGSISNAKVVKSVHELLDSEALRCVSAMPAWTPGSHQGKPVRVRYTIPVNFTLNDSDSDFKSVRVS